MDCFIGMAVFSESMTFSEASMAITNHVETGQIFFGSAQLAEFDLRRVFREMIHNNFPRDFLGSFGRIKSPSRMLGVSSIEVALVIKSPSSIRSMTVGWLAWGIFAGTDGSE